MDFYEREALLRAKRALANHSLTLHQDSDIYMRYTYEVKRDGIKIYSSMNPYAIEAFAKGVAIGAKNERIKCS